MQIPSPDDPPELVTSVNDDPHLYYNNVGKPLKRIAIAILVFMVGLAATLVALALGQS